MKQNDNLELKKIKNAIDFSNLLENSIRENLHDLFEFLAAFTSIYKKEIDKLPYHINLIDELHADENAYSRVFAKLLRYKEKSEYPFIEKFLKEVCKFDLCVEEPIVEKVDSCGRIDIPIFDKKYVVLIENKITDKASDQNNSNGGQLARYIETIKNKYERKLEEIYVVYTPKYTREPSEEAWISKDNYSYKNDFQNRFCSLSYREDIYRWLKKDILPTIGESNKYLYSAVEQYVDHLEGMFSLRIINKQMNMELQKYIKKELGLEDHKPEKALEILSKKETELNSAIEQIQQLKNNYEKQIVKNHFENWEKLLQTDFPNHKIVGVKSILYPNYISIGIKFSIENKDFVAIIENPVATLNVYFGVSSKFTGKEEKSSEIPETLQRIIKDKLTTDDNKDWYGFKGTSFDEAYLELKSLIGEILSSNE